MGVRYLEDLEPERGCGYRRLGKIYVIGTGISVPCHRLPLPLEVCPVCGQGIKFSRSWIEINPKRLFGNCYDTTECPHCGKTLELTTLDSGRMGYICEDCHAEYQYTPCLCKLKEDEHGKCPVCEPPEHGYILWVGGKYYTPSSFIMEARKMGVSKAVPYVPKNLEVGKTIVYLAHKQAVKKIVEDKESVTGYKEEYAPGIFFAFVPIRLEVLVKKSEATPELIENYEKRGIDVVVVPDDYEERVKRAEEAKRKINGRKPKALKGVVG